MSKAGDARDKKRQENMAKLQGAIMDHINEAKLPWADLYLVLSIVLRQAEDAFMKRTMSGVI